jgi:hypothetical protein
MKLFHIVIITLLLLVNSISAGFCQDVTLSWDPSPTDGVAGYKVYYKQGDMNYPFDGTGAAEGPSPVDVGDVLSTTLTDLPDGETFYFSVTAYVDETQESSYSNIVSNSWIPALLLPANGATGEPVPVTFQWVTAPDGYDVTYTLIYGTDRNEVTAAGVSPVVPMTPDKPTIPPATTIPVIIILLAALIYTSAKTKIKYKPQIAVIISVIFLGGLLTACGGGGGGGDSSSTGHSATDPVEPGSTLYSVNKGSSDYHQAYDLESATTYYWKVVATDTQDPNLTYESEVIQFTTESF